MGKTFTRLSKIDISQLSDLAKALFHFIEEFRNTHNIKDFTYVYMLQDPIQNVESENCGPFQLFFHEHLFGAAADSEILSLKKINKIYYWSTSKWNVFSEFRD